MQLPPNEGLVKGLTMVGPFFAVLLEFVGEIAQNHNIMWFKAKKKHQHHNKM